MQSLALSETCSFQSNQDTLAPEKIVLVNGIFYTVFKRFFVEFQESWQESSQLWRSLMMNGKLMRIVMRASVLLVLFAPAGQGKIALISGGYIDMWAIAAERTATMIG